MERPHLRRVRSRILVLVCACLCAGLASAGGDDEIVKEFRRYFKKYTDTATRVEAVLALSGTESTGVVDALLPVLKDSDPEVVRAAVRVLGGFQSRPPVDGLLTSLDATKDEATRVGILRALSEGRYADVQEALVPLLADSSWDVRRRTVQALVAVRDPALAPAIVPLCQDAEGAVRCAALDGLAELGSELVIPCAIADLANPSWQVRTSAIHALGRVRSGDSIEPLIERMAVEEGRLIADIGVALGEITGRNFGDRLDAWQNFWSTFKGRFQIPTDAELARLRAIQREREEAYKPPGAVSYHGVETPSRSILFVIDVSGSMEQEVVDRDRYKDGDYPSLRRIDIVKTELARTVETLEPYVRFNCIAFGTDVRTWKKKLVTANPLNKSSCIAWASRLEAIGGQSKQSLAEVGLAGAANLEAGKTNTYGALMEALGVGEDGDVGRDYEVEADTVFFLSDGRPSHGKFVDTDDILREVRAANELRKIVIHTIALGEFEKEFMRRLAEDNGGVFVDLGR